MALPVATWGGVVLATVLVVAAICIAVWKAWY
jgi:hypothetical protein